MWISAYFSAQLSLWGFQSPSGFWKRGADDTGGGGAMKVGKDKKHSECLKQILNCIAHFFGVELNAFV